MKKFRALLWRTSFYFQFWCRKKAMESKYPYYKLYYLMDDLMKEIAAGFEWGFFRKRIK